MFKQGLKHGTYVLAITLMALVFSLPLKSHETSELIVGITVIVSWLVVGYFFKKHHGSVFSIFTDAKKLRGIWYYIIGAGIIWGPVKLFSSEFPIPDVNPIVNIALIVVSVPLAGMSVIGALIIGGIFYRIKAHSLG
ncbi:MAG: hypothetical protein OEY52_16245 [Gammaproteobacteria bacterium]|nr:hypothetical protein [Gammaproteobacteria bacterium]